ncbi:MAG: MOSC domain-containing protein [Gemmataceae bacterium]
MAGGRHLTLAELEAGLDTIRRSPRDEGTLTLIVRRPAIGEREVLAAAELDSEDGLVGDTWRSRGSRYTADGAAHPEMQINIMNARAVALVAHDPSRRPLAGDQLFIDLDLSEDNLPPGTWLAVGTAVLQITPVPHTGCVKFKARFGADAVKFVNSPVGKQLRLRGLNARVLQSGSVRAGDVVRKVPGE